MYTCERDAAGIAGYLNHLTGGMFSGRTVNSEPCRHPRDR